MQTIKVIPIYNKYLVCDVEIYEAEAHDWGLRIRFKSID
jgi:hypothetical protein